jgi:hypothetical protein
VAPACQIFPEELPQHVRQEPKLSAEVRFYDQLRQQMGAGWVVFYDVAWLALVHPNGAPRDGQVDFIAAHPSKGILLIEIKGGRIRFDGPRRQWISSDRHGVDHDISPFAQVRDSKYALLNKLKSLRGMQNRWIEIGHAVAFPDSARPRFAATPDAPPDIIIGADDLYRLPERIQEILAFSRGQSGHPFEHGNVLIAELIRLLARSIELPNPLAVQAAAEKQEMIRLTEGQLRILTLLKRIRRAAIGGCAGSGKTFLAVAKAKQLAGEDFRTLLTCYTDPLARLLERLTAGTENLEVATLHALARRWVSGLPALTGEEADQAYPQVLFDAMQRQEVRPYHAIIVDEGQDFTPDWWLALESCLREGKESVFYIFHDTHQTLYRGAGTLPEGMSEYPLEDNVRNTQAICQALAHHYEGQVTIQPRGPAGRMVEVHRYGSTDELGQVLGKTLRRLVETERFTNRDLVVLTPKSLEGNSCLMKLRLPVGLELVSHEPAAQTRQVLCSTIHDFKGLERKVALIVELDEALPQDLPTRAALCYVAFSRPRHHLIVFATPGAPPDLLPGK